MRTGLEASRLGRQRPTSIASTVSVDSEDDICLSMLAGRAQDANATSGSLLEEIEASWRALSTSTNRKEAQQPASWTQSYQHPKRRVNRVSIASRDDSPTPPRFELPITVDECSPEASEDRKHSSSPPAVPASASNVGDNAPRVVSAFARAVAQVEEDKENTEANVAEDLSVPLMERLRLKRNKSSGAAVPRVEAEERGRPSAKAASAQQELKRKAAADEDARKLEAREHQRAAEELKKQLASEREQKKREVEEKKRALQEQERLRVIAEEKKRQEAEERKQALQEQARLKEIAEEKKRREAEEKKRALQEQARLKEIAEEKKRREAEEKKRALQEQVRLKEIAEEKEKKKREAEEKKRALQEQARLKEIAEEKKRREAEEKKRALQEQARLKEIAEEKKRREAEEKKRALEEQERLREIAEEKERLAAERKKALDEKKRVLQEQERLREIAEEKERLAADKKKALAKAAAAERELKRIAAAEEASRRETLLREQEDELRKRNEIEQEARNRAVKEREASAAEKGTEKRRRSLSQQAHQCEHIDSKRKAEAAHTFDKEQKKSKVEATTCRDPENGQSNIHAFFKKADSARPNESERLANELKSLPLKERLLRMKSTSSDCVDTAPLASLASTATIPSHMSRPSSPENSGAVGSSGLPEASSVRKTTTPRVVMKVAPAVPADVAEKKHVTKDREPAERATQTMAKAKAGCSSAKKKAKAKAKQGVGSKKVSCKEIIAVSCGSAKRSSTSAPFNVAQGECRRGLKRSLPTNLAEKAEKASKEDSPDAVPSLGSLLESSIPGWQSKRLRPGKGGLGRPGFTSRPGFASGMRRFHLQGKIEKQAQRAPQHAAPTPSPVKLAPKIVEEPLPPPPANMTEREKAAYSEVQRILQVRKESFKYPQAWGTAVLNAPQTDLASIQQAYRKLMQKLHPDKVGHLPQIERAVECIREAKELCERSLSRQVPPGAPRNLRSTTLCATKGKRRFRISWEAPAEKEAAPVQRYLVNAFDPAYGKALTITILEPDYSEELRRYVRLEELTTFNLSEQELTKMPSLFKQRVATLQVAASNDSGTGQWASVQVRM